MVQGAAHRPPAAIESMRIDHRGLHIGMTEQHLHRAVVIAVFDQVRGERMPQTVPRRSRRQAGLAHGRRDRPVRRLLTAYTAWSPQSIMVPVHERRRGHPTLIAWRHVSGVRAHPNRKGINGYLRSQLEQIMEVPAPNGAALGDMDTPEDYERFAGLGV